MRVVRRIITFSGACGRTGVASLCKSEVILTVELYMDVYVLRTLN